MPRVRITMQHHRDHSSHRQDHLGKNSTKLSLDEARLQAHFCEDATRSRETLFPNTTDAVPGHVVAEAHSKASKG